LPIDSAKEAKHSLRSFISSIVNILLSSSPSNPLIISTAVVNEGSISAKIRTLDSLSFVLICDRKEVSLTNALDKIHILPSIVSFGGSLIA